MRHKCSTCDYIYDPKTGDPIENIPPGTPFEHLSECPACSGETDFFEEVQDPPPVDTTPKATSDGG